MANEIIAYLEMCQRENASLQRGMNYRLGGGNHSVILMSVCPNAPYQDRIEDDGATLIYEGHDVPRTQKLTDPKNVDQPEYTPSGSLTQNGKFHKAAQDYKRGEREPELVRVYEKIKQGIWTYNGLFHLVDSWRENDEYRQVFKFKAKTLASESPMFLRPSQRAGTAPASATPACRSTLFSNNHGTTMTHRGLRT